MNNKYPLTFTEALVLFIKEHRPIAAQGNDPNFEMILYHEMPQGLETPFFWRKGFISKGGSLGSLLRESPKLFITRDDESYMWRIVTDEERKELGV